MKRLSWKEFRDSGFLWWINMILHTFGLAIVVEMDDEEIVDVYPARVSYRGFGEKFNTVGYQKVSQYIKDNSEQFLQESQE